LLCGGRLLEHLADERALRSYEPAACACARLPGIRAFRVLLSGQSPQLVI
jgi:hypothetical protein